MINENEYEAILEACIEQIATGASSLEECLVRYPYYADELEPILLAATRLRRVRNVKPPPFSRGRIRAKIEQAIEASPPRRRGLPPFFLADSTEGGGAFNYTCDDPYSAGTERPAR